MLSSILGDAAAKVPFHRWMQWIGLLCCIAINLFVVGTTGFGKYPAQVQYGVILTLGLSAIFLFKPGPLTRQGRRSWADTLLSLLFIGATLFSGIYFLYEYHNIADMREGIPNPSDIWCYALGTIAVLEGARRAEGWILLAVVLGAFGYLFFGNYLPGILHHRPFAISEVLEISYSYQGIYGIALGSVCDVVYVFVILGAALRITGAGDFFNYLAMRLTHRRRSGPAQCAIFASSMFGSINGSAPANVAATGVLTIPLMKRAGFSGCFAGGVEATASCVGQIMPPVMGVGAFIMSEITGIPYVRIMLVALVPAFLFIFSLSVAVSLEAGRLNLEPLKSKALEWNRLRSRQAVILVGGFGTLLTMLFSGYSPTYCGLMATLVVLGLASIFSITRLSISQWITFLIDGGRDGLGVALACAAIGIIIGAVTTTGIGIKINQVIVALGQQQLLYALILSAVCAILLGMGLPTAASYLMVIFVAGPAVMQLGVTLLQAHLFIFYYAVLSAITPPVALAVFAAAAIARENPIRLAGSAIRLCYIGFLLPIIWIYHPDLFLADLPLSDWPRGIAFLGALLIAITAMNASHIGYFKGDLNFPVRVLLLAAGLAILIPGAWLTVGGTALAVGLFTICWWKHGQIKA
jgi:TRAP transporter 4TM/12TM fusion protein